MSIFKIMRYIQYIHIPFKGHYIYFSCEISINILCDYFIPTAVYNILSYPMYFQYEAK